MMSTSYTREDTTFESHGTRCAAWLYRPDEVVNPAIIVMGHGFSGRDLILLGGGLFLIFKATWEIYDKLEADHVVDVAFPTWRPLR